MAATQSLAPFPALVERRAARGRWVVACEHASNLFPEAVGSLGLGEAERAAHIAWDPGALPLARGLAAALDGVLVAARVSRLVYDCNRPPDAAGAMAVASEHYRIPGNEGLAPAARAARARAVYLPFQEALRREIVGRIAEGRRPALVTVHSFTPVWFGTPRRVELGLIHDADPALARAAAALAAARTPLVSALNAPYSAADGVTHTLRLQAVPYGIPNVMIEVANSLLATPAAQAAMAATLAPILAAALESVEPAAIAAGAVS
ncbi:MAG: N-formylglutamate amidohydrolase [Rhodobacteraceae bacterium]|nr:N-formylglutamate amidohydrolase [Paracoccaceae bacterium]